jgi:hypothetical protein
LRFSCLVGAFGLRVAEPAPERESIAMHGVSGWLASPCLISTVIDVLMLSLSLRSPPLSRFPWPARLPRPWLGLLD